MQSALIKTEDLYEWADTRQPGKLMEWLRENHIPFRLSKTGKPITTLAAVNGSLANNSPDDEIDF